MSRYRVIDEHLQKQRLRSRLREMRDVVQDCADALAEELEYPSVDLVKVVVNSLRQAVKDSKR